jgi:hypothetical protein
MRQLMLTAKTTLLPANHSLDTKKGLHSTTRLDDRLVPIRSSSSLILWETAEGVTLSCSAALSKLPVRTTEARAERRA